MAPPQTSLSAFYSTPHIDNIEPSGKVTYTDTTTEQHWRLYARCETARSAKTVAATDADDADDADDAADADAQVNPRLAAVIQHLTEARADLDVIVDVASVLADTQQHLSIQHVPRSITGEARHQQVVAMALKKRQLRGIADRLSASANVLRDKYLREPAADAFAIDLEELERRWAVSEYPHLGTNYEDDCFAISVRFAVEDAWSDWLRSHSLGKDTFVIARDRNADGGACAVFNDELTFGWERIDAALRQRRSERAWRLVQVALEQEAVTTNTDDGAGAVHDKVTYGALDVQRAVLALSRGATGSPSSPSSLSSSVDRICLDDRMLYVEKFARTDECRTLFKKKGLKALEDAVTWHHVPDMVRRTTPTRHEPFLQQLCAWLSFAAMWHEVSESLGADEPARRRLHDYIAALAASSHCVPARVRVGSASISIGKDYDMVTTTGENSTATIGRLQLLELLAAGPTSVDIDF